MKPFFTFYGGKYRAAPRYPKPRYDTIVEPFAGSAGYSLRYPDRKVILVDRDPVIAKLWKYLIRVQPEEILALPDLEPDQTVDSLNVGPEPKSLIGFWLNKGSASPCKTPSAWMRKGTHATSFWGSNIRGRIASQLENIRHWTVIEGDYQKSPDITATWFIDPPYADAGKHYRIKFTDYDDLSSWSQTRRGQIIVCENDGATWLPFRPFLMIKGNESKTGGKISRESIWTNENAA